VFNKTRLMLRQMLPDIAFRDEFPLLETKFLEQYMDSDLELAAQAMQDPWTMSEIQDVQGILKRQEAAVVARDRERHQEVMMRAEAASFEQLSMELALDHDDAKRYLAQKADAGKAWERKMAAHKVARYSRGLEVATAFMKKRLDIVDLPSSAMLGREVALMRRQMQEENIGGSGKVYIMIVVDLNIDHGSTILSCLKPLCDILQASADNCMVMMYPSMHKNLRLSAKLKAERLIEDKLLSFGMNLEHEGSVHYYINEEHHNDKRPLDGRVRMIVANDFADSRWLQTKAGRGNYGEAPLVKVKDMLPPASRIKSAPTEKQPPHPHERAMQRGVSAAQHVLQTAMNGMSFQEGDKLMILQVNVGEYGDFCHAALNLMLQGPIPYIAFKGIYFGLAAASDNATGKTKHPVEGMVLASADIPMHRLMQKRLMEEWWDRQPEAGPKDLVARGRDEVGAAPMLRVCHWVGNVPVPVESAIDKFAPNSDSFCKWQTLVKDHKEIFGCSAAATSASRPSQEPGSVEVHRVAVDTGPDFSIDPKPVDYHVLLDLPGSETEPVNIVSMAEAKRNVPAVYITEDGNVWIAAGDSEEITIGPCELFGFGRGSVNTFPASGIGSWKDGIPFHCVHDVDPVILVRKNGDTAEKTLMPLAAVLCDAEVRDGVANLEVQNHKLDPLLRNGERMLHRYTVEHQGSDAWGFVPDALTGDTAKVKHAELGVVLFRIMHDKAGADTVMSAIKGEHACVMWETQIDMVPPPNLAVLKPKMWLLGQASLKPGSFYRVL